MIQDGFRGGARVGCQDADGFFTADQRGPAIVERRLGDPSSGSEREGRESFTIISAFCSRRRLGLRDAVCQRRRDSLKERERESLD